MSPAGFEPAIPPGERPQTNALERAGMVIGHLSFLECNNVNFPYTRYEGV